MSVARRTLLTATAAGTLLAALWFVPSANATGDTGENRPQSAPAAPAVGAADDASDARLADTGAGPETTPYLVGGTALLGLGTAFVTYSVRRSVTGARPAL
ncbi:hypothetical protein PV749_34830 [Streptomyces sp. ID03-2B]|uniref:Uncharacterized protein n=1 Tax=Streptomyces caviscabies TaxID=90079 RepID=A0ABW2M8Y5_9ACTN|nr:MULTISPECIES: hypothetical protein [unclassified Streptomyces]MDX3504291.1 hypothetical protein [Streptomyces sp. ATCC51928]MDX3596311.1 hypothetical protein [Streptomyces sp. ID03-2B]MDX5519443.1 hypothetical protein [Streptomyces sp. DE06-01C]